MRSLAGSASLVFFASFVLLFAACGLDPTTPEEQARALYLRNCATCHGAQGQGMGRMGNTLVANAFIQERDDDALIAFLKVGRMPDDPANESKMLMPPKGGNPKLSDEDLRLIVSFLRTLQE